MITLHGNEISSPTNKARYAANALKLDYQFKVVNLMAGENKSADYLKLHPAGKVPVLVDGDFVLFESNAICKYMAQKKSSDLYPDDVKRRSHIDQWMDFASIHIGHAMSRVFFNRVAYNVLGTEKDERSLKDGLEFLARFLPVVDQQIQKGGYLVGDTLSLADICLLANLDQAEISSVSFDPYPQLKAWQQKLQAEEFYQKCFKSYSQMLASAFAP